MQAPSLVARHRSLQDACSSPVLTCCCRLWRSGVTNSAHHQLVAIDLPSNRNVVNCVAVLCTASVISSDAKASVTRPQCSGRSKQCPRRRRMHDTVGNTSSLTFCAGPGAPRLRDLVNPEVFDATNIVARSSPLRPGLEDMDGRRPGEVQAFGPAGLDKLVTLSGHIAQREFGAAIEERNTQGLARRPRHSLSRRAVSVARPAKNFERRSVSSGR